MWFLILSHFIVVDLVLILYFLGVNLVALLAYGHDKLNSKLSTDRYPETRLLLYLWAGGIAGAWIGICS